MKRAWAAIVVLVAACGSFEATPGTTEPDLDGGTDVAITAPPKEDGGSPARYASSPRVCTLVVDAKFDTAAISGWQPPRTTGQVGVGIGSVTAGGETSMALGAQAVANPNSGVAAQAYLERLAVETTTVAQLEYDLNYNKLEDHALVGCTLGPRQGLALEPRIGLEQGPNGLAVTGSLQTQESSLPAGDATVIATLPPPNAWVHVRAEIALADGAIKRSVTIGESRYDVPTVAAPASAAASFDGIHVTCGLKDVYAPKATSVQSVIYIRNLRVSTCTP